MFIALYILCLLFIIFFIINILYTSYVKKNSISISKLTALNNDYKFDYTKYKFKENHTTKYKYDRDTPHKYMHRHIYDNLDMYTDYIVANIKQNMVSYTSYNELYDELNFNIIKNDNNRSAGFIRKVNKLYKKYKHKKPTSFISYIIMYQSPKGRNTYSQNDIFLIETIEYEIDIIKKEIEHKNSRQVQIKRERSIITPGLSYNIFKRDSFKCKICGSKESDGVKLHVDHIIPISKGGLSNESNLQTLCDTCNLGKSNKT